MDGVHLVVLGLMGFVHHLVFRKTCGKWIHFWPLVKGYEGTYVACPRSLCSRLGEEWDVNWWRTPPALLTLQGPVDFQ